MSKNYSCWFPNKESNFFSIFVKDNLVLLIYSTKNPIAGVIPNQAFGYSFFCFIINKNNNIAFIGCYRNDFIIKNVAPWSWQKNKYFIQFFLHLVQIFECKYRCWVKPYFQSVFLNKKLDIK